MIEVDKKEQKAAAVTAIKVQSRSMKMPEQPVTIRFDRPFSLVIQSSELKLPIFVGYISL